MTRSWSQRLRGFLTRNSSLHQEDRNPERVDDAAPEERQFTLADLNLEAARRQAKIGKGYARDKYTKKRLEELQQGTVTLPPHKSWSGDYTDWTADPFQDLNWRFQFHTLRWINPYLWDALDGNQESKVEWKRIVRSWADANLPPEQAADKYAWMDMTDGNRAIQLSLGAPLIDEDDHWYADLLAAHRNWLLDDTRIVPGNHGLHQNLGLFVVSAVLSDQIGINRSLERLGSQVLEAFDEKGLNEEGSVAYHQINVVWWTQAQKRLKLEGYDLPQDAVDRLDKAGEAMAYLVLPDATMPQIGDGGRGRGQRDMHPLLDQVIKGKVQERDLPLFKHFPNGFSVSRSGWGHTRPFQQESHTIIRHGIDLERHSHNDRGSVHIYTRGRRWITDGGFHSYQQRNRHRDYTKSRSAHNLVDLPEQEYDKTGDVPVQLVQHEDDLHVVEILDENFQSAQWRRRVIYLPTLDTWVIWDRVQAEQPETIHQQWLIDLGVRVTQRSASCLTLQDKTQALKMEWFGDTPVIDIAKGDRNSHSKRGLIGIGWKKMRNGTSVHANFKSTSVDSIVVISADNGAVPSINLEEHKPMSSFTLTLEHDDVTRSLRVNSDTTTLTH